jgi:predicted RNA binding protein YcfA (HicA-like mRNA interferase family)
MGRKDKLLGSVMNGAGDVAFRDFAAVAKRFGFALDRVSGSHHIYVHPHVSRPLNVQRVGKDVKRYQLRQFRAMVIEFNLQPDKA